VKGQKEPREAGVWRGFRRFHHGGTICWRNGWTSTPSTVTRVRITPGERTMRMAVVEKCSKKGQGVRDKNFSSEPHVVSTQRGCGCARYRHRVIKGVKPDITFIPQASRDRRLLFSSILKTEPQNTWCLLPSLRAGIGM
jgi:hypothetical protein